MANCRQQYGGYDQEFVNEVADRFICQICAKVLSEPHLAVCCGQHFCQSCLNEWFTKHRKQSCPHCRAEGENFNHVINKGLRSEISQLKIRCSNWRQGRKGCDWTGELGELKTHLGSENGCGFVLVTCPNKCMATDGVYGEERQLKRMDLNKHLGSECSLRPHKCEHCGFKGTYYEITGGTRRGVNRISDRFLRSEFIRSRVHSHYDTCPEFPLPCPNKCGAENVKRKDIEYHRMECPLERVECPFLEAGCKDVLNRSQLDKHMASNQQTHLFMMMKDYKDTKQKLCETEAKLSSAIATIQLLQHGTVASEAAPGNLVIDRSQRLTKEGDFVNVIVPKVTEIGQSGKGSYSTPFFYRDGYKLCLALHIHDQPWHTMISTYDISIALCLLKGEYDYQLSWPMLDCSTTGHLAYRFEKFGVLSELYNHTRFSVCSVLQRQDRLTSNQPKELEKIDNLHIPIGNIRFVNDSLVLKVICIYDGCVLRVDVI